MWETVKHTEQGNLHDTGQNYSDCLKFDGPCVDCLSLSLALPARGQLVTGFYSCSLCSVCVDALEVTNCMPVCTCGCGCVPCYCCPRLMGQMWCVSECGWGRKSGMCSSLPPPPPSSAKLFSPPKTPDIKIYIKH